MNLRHELRGPGRELVTCLILFSVAFIVYCPLLEPAYGFILFDDPMYVLNNGLVRGGFTPANLWAVFSEPQVGNYHPFAMLSLMLDHKWMGLDPWMYHFTSIFFHSLNAALVYRVLSQMTGAYWKSLLVALLFAVHPSRVESVAWISERKDVLFLFFWLLATLAYVRWVRTRRRIFYIACIFLFLGSLMSKPMAVTFPFALLVLDFWPLGRIELSGWKKVLAGGVRLCWEKVPLFLLTVAFCLLTVWAQQGAIATPELVSKTSTALNACGAYAMYFVKTLCPTEQAIFYPYRALSTGTAVSLGLLLACVTGLALAWIRSRPYVLAGWLLFLGTLVPVIGIVQVGAQSMADRYLYLPGLPILWILVWLAGDLAQVSATIARLVQGGFAALVAVYAALTLNYLEKWQNSETLFNHSLVATGENSFPHLGLASWHLNLKDYRKAATHYAAFLKAEAADPGASELSVDRAWIWGNLGCMAAKLEDWESAKRFTTIGLRLNPNLATAWWNLSVINTKLSLEDEAAIALRRYQRLKPGATVEGNEVLLVPPED